MTALESALFDLVRDELRAIGRDVATEFQASGRADKRTTAHRAVAEHKPSSGSSTATPVATSHLRKETHGEPPFAPAAARHRQQVHLSELNPRGTHDELERSPRETDRRVARTAVDAAASKPPPPLPRRRLPQPLPWFLSQAPLPLAPIPCEPFREIQLQLAAEDA